MWSQVRWRIKRRIYSYRCEAIFSTPPIRARNDGVIIFSMIGTSVMTSYLIAAKSLHHHLKRGRMVIMDDGTLTELDRSLLRRHLDDPHILSLKDVDVGSCPQGGTWERLLTILDIAADDYVIQLDSDTVTVGPVPHVEEAINANRCFTLLGAETQVRTVMEVIEFTKYSFPGGQPSKEDFEGHIQGATESILTRLAITGLDRPRYVRGCSGFAGFARGSNRHLAAAFSQSASAILGAERWKEWGTEQITSNFVIANSENALVLPPSLYENYWGSSPSRDIRFLHFIGTHRWHAWEYQRRSLAVIRTLNAAGRGVALAA
ncbi:hypothetical protein V475_02880 [Sphingobium baderi LL03]|uniref:Uncharacterized protein n=1 Tax=Sphingobium wenxiniae (strain DSM 21828 / CGMCC 1.7748 / JZ-1) TaxID=595605 RepID=A0A562KQJ0_SPHWJ|nr:hypothetical protein V475_02880 [Sphingobium baderi LL03]TWH97660.1 hypothetical protein IQ35_00257 [Sphingobium wenxiniae]